MTYKLGDARNTQRIITLSPRLIITSPPYWNLKDYGSQNQVGIHNDDYQEYLKDLKDIFTQIHTISTKDATCWVVIDTLKENGEMKPLPFDLLNEMKDIGWILQDIIIWKKNKTLPWSSKGKFRSIFEYILFFSKKRRDFVFKDKRIRAPKDLSKYWKTYPERYNPNGKMPTGVWEFDIITQGWGENWVQHTCPFPPELVERIVRLASEEDDVVFDPFAGSGMVLAVAEALNRKPIGLDLSENFKQIYEKKVKKKVSTLMKKNGSSAAFSTLIRNLRKRKVAKILVKQVEEEELSEYLKGIELIDSGEKSAHIRVELQSSLVEDDIITHLEDILSSLEMDDTQLIWEIGQVNTSQPLIFEANRFYTNVNKGTSKLAELSHPVFTDVEIPNIEVFENA